MTRMQLPPAAPARGKSRRDTLRRTVLAGCLGLLLVPAPAGAGRQMVAVPLWSEFDGTRWGDLTLDGTTRSAFEREYSSRSAGRDDVLEANTSRKTKTQLFLVFNGPGPEARLAWIVCYYDRGAEAPRPAAFEGRYEAREVEGFPSTRHAGWRLLASNERGVTALVERERDGERVAGLVFGGPERTAALLSRERPTGGDGSDDPPAETPTRDAPRAKIGRIDFTLYTAPDVRVDRNHVREELQRAAEERVRSQPGLQVTDGSNGSLTAVLDIEPRQPGDRRHLALVAHVTLDAEGGGGAIHVRGDEERSILPADSSDRRIAEEGRRLLNRGIDAVARTAADRMQKHQGQSLDEARKQARVAVIDYLSGAAR
jgi:hypothetical protein